MTPTTVVNLRASPLDLELREPFAVSSGTHALAKNVLVEIELADGTLGLGEAAPLPPVDGQTQASSLAAIDKLREHLVGSDARTWRRTAHLLAEAAKDASAARASLETALLDALACHAKLPLWSFFGGAGTAVETDMTITTGDVAHAEASARDILSRGITTIKLKVGAGDADDDVARAAAVAKIAPRARLLADANAAWTTREALAFLAGCRRQNVTLALFEQPVARGDLDGLAELARDGGVPVCADESAQCAADVHELARRGVQAVNLKHMKAGIAESLGMAEAARAAGLLLMMGGMVESRLAMSTSAHFAAGLGGFSFADLDTPMFILREPLTGGFVQTGARLDVATVARGHGVRLMTTGTESSRVSQS